MYWAGTRLGPVRLLGAYAWRSLLNTGVVVPNGSDFPVEQVNPLISFHSAVSRQDARDWPPDGWYPSERMTRDEALKSITLWPAYSAFQENVLGSLTPGKFADFVVLDQDIMRCPPNSSSAPRCSRPGWGAKRCTRPFREPASGAHRQDVLPHPRDDGGRRRRLHGGFVGRARTRPAAVVPSASLTTLTTVMYTSVGWRRPPSCCCACASRRARTRCGGHCR